MQYLNIYKYEVDGSTIVYVTCCKTAQRILLYPVHNICALLHYMIYMIHNTLLHFMCSVNKFLHRINMQRPYITKLEKDENLNIVKYILGSRHVQVLNVLNVFSLTIFAKVGHRLCQVFKHLQNLDMHSNQTVPDSKHLLDLYIFRN